MSLLRKLMLMRTGNWAQGSEFRDILLSNFSLLDMRMRQRISRASVRQRV